VKNIKSMLALIVFGVLISNSCTYDSLIDEDALTGIPDSDEAAFVRFDKSVISIIEVGEGDGVTSVNIEFIFPLEADIEVDYSFSGSAVWGVDYEVDGATESGGNAAIVHDPAVISIGSTMIEILLIKDDAVDGEKDLFITLDDAVASDGTRIDVGQGNLYKVATFRIIDID
jgi:hypothetical protein